MAVFQKSHCLKFVVEPQGQMSKIERIWLDVAFTEIVFHHYKFKKWILRCCFSKLKPAVIDANYKSLNYKLKKKKDFNI